MRPISMPSTWQIMVQLSVELFQQYLCNAIFIVKFWVQLCYGSDDGAYFIVLLLHAFVQFFTMVAMILPYLAAVFLCRISLPYSSVALFASEGCEWRIGIGYACVLVLK